MNYQHLKKYYNNKKVFLTGHTGFKGAWMLTWLQSLGAQIKGYSLAPEQKPNLYSIIRGDTLCNSVIADIRDKELLKQEILEFQPDFIFHLAAQPLVRLSYEIPIETFAVNAMGTVNLLDAIRFLEKPCSVVLITTDKVYENLEWEYPYRENDRLGGYDPYSGSKACAELIANSYRLSFFSVQRYVEHHKSIASARAGNVIGGGDWAKDRIIPDIIRALQVERKIKVRNPKAIRPWQHVVEPLGGYLHLATKMVDEPTNYCEAWNFGPLVSGHISVECLVQTAIKKWGKGAYENSLLKNQPHEAGLLKLDINKTQNILGWHPKYNEIQAIEKTIEWYKKYDEEGNGKQHIIDIIIEYSG